MLYTCLVGLAPYRDCSMYATFQRIQRNDYKIPSFVAEEARDLISKLLVLDPEKRIGFNDWDNDYADIRNHPFFEGINWEELPTTPIPEFIPYEKAKDYVDEENETNASNETQSNNEIQPLQNEIENENTQTSNDVKVEENNTSTNNNDEQTESLNFLEKGENIIYKETIKKKRRLSIKTRNLILTSHKRLLYYSPVNNELKGEIKLSSIIDITTNSNSNKWYINTKLDDKKRVYNLISHDNESPAHWKEEIEKMLKD